MGGFPVSMPPGAAKVAPAFDPAEAGKGGQSRSG
jgi:hypothetical protein